MADFSKQSVKTVILPATVLLTIGIVISFALALTNQITAGRIAQLEEKNQRETMSRLVVAEKYEYAVYKADVASSQAPFDYYIAKQDSKILAYLFVTAAKGYGGDVSVMTAVEPDGTVKSVAILDVSQETPGLGQNAAKESFYLQYSGKVSDVSLRKNGAKEENNEVNAVTGATITSTAVTRAVNAALDHYEAVKGEQNNVG